ncbi:calcium-binding protein [Streptomyces sp. NPDC050560]|uniref:calcium-binding protein n=1 Tax=Streptomyces sp. NPDC050560 TaxID=3365630 RepID=UPI0037BDCF7A
MRTNRIVVAAASAVLALGGAVLTASAAQADEPSAAHLVLQDNEVWYKAAPGQVNHLTVASDVRSNDDGSADFLITFKDVVPISVDTDKCAYPAPDDHTVALCTVLAPQNSDDTDDYDVDLGDGDDTAVIDPASTAYATIHGGAGDDDLSGSDAVVFHGDAGDDTLDGGGGVWSMGPYGDDGDDTITHCAMDCYGGPGNDTLSGGDLNSEESDNTLHGGPGDDVLYGNDGNDVLYGGDDNDTLYGNAGDDQLFGENGDDVLWGGPGTDTLDGGAGTNELHQD